MIRNGIRSKILTLIGLLAFFLIFTTLLCNNGDGSIDGTDLNIQLSSAKCQTKRPTGWSVPLVGPTGWREGIKKGLWFY